MSDARGGSLVLAAAFLLFAWAPWTAAQATRPPTEQETLPLCGEAQPRKACRIEIDRIDPHSGRTYKVENETSVTVVLVKKSPFETCKNELKRQEMPDSSMVPSMLGLLVKAFTVKALDRAARAGDAPAAIDQALTQFLEAAAALARALQAFELEQYRPVVDGLKRFYDRDFFEHGEQEDEARRTFERERQAQLAAVGAAERLVPPGNVGLEAAYKGLVEQWTAFKKTLGAEQFPELEDKMSVARRAIGDISAAVTALDAARARFRSTLAYLDRLKDPQFELRLPVRRDRNAKVTGSIGCSHEVTGKPMLDPPVVYTVAFGSTPRFSLTGGFIYSSVPRDDISVQRVVASRNDGTVTDTQRQIVDQQTQPQFVPFSFLNIRLGDPIYARGRRWTINIAPGFGVNANSGDAAAEFFAGLSLGIDNVFIAGGLHWGHDAFPTHGYKVDDIVPDSVSEVPIETALKKRPGGAIAVSYRVPLK